ncbi:hypothetical protein UFOVP1656_19 [uncultured Caudovirales phage]|uniref:Uncharacterized protein n=1 Tax=uncultured Caudovirales phage TaxID=2100421 RepID=A0A6J5T360_9CAUD|nr:hypothetical protein UFOVP1656_19 [uncultured Caudovirales phage]
MRYTVDPITFAINVFNDGQDIPFQYQPTYPNGDPFDSVEEASGWAEASIAAFDDAVMTYAPAGKGWEPEVKPDPVAKEKVLAKLGITAEEARLLLS